MGTHSRERESVFNARRGTSCCITIVLSVKEMPLLVLGLSYYKLCSNLSSELAVIIV
jgi:hypothetical protein